MLFITQGNISATIIIAAVDNFNHLKNNNLILYKNNSINDLQNIILYYKTAKKNSDTHRKKGFMFKLNWVIFNQKINFIFQVIYLYFSLT